MLLLRVTPYFEGVAFNKFWVIPMGVLPIGLIAFLTFFFSALSSVVGVIRKKAGKNDLVVVGLLPILIFAIYMAPFPSFVDGMYKTVKETLPMEEIVSLSVEARELNPKWSNYEEHAQLIKSMRTKYPNALNLSHLPPRINVSDSYVSVFYGSSLVKHWGYLFTDSDAFPIEHIPEDMYKKVYEGVWVYHDVW